MGGGKERGRDGHASEGRVQRSATEKGELLRRLEACNGGEIEKSVVGTATRRQSTCRAAVRPRKNCCDAWKRATDGREERGRDGHASAEHVQHRAADEEKLLRRLSGSVQRSVGGTATRRQSTCSAVRPRRKIVAALGSVQRKGPKSAGGTGTRRQSPCSAVRPTKDSRSRRREHDCAAGSRLRPKGESARRMLGSTQVEDCGMWGKNLTATLGLRDRVRENRRLSD